MAVWDVRRRGDGPGRLFDDSTGVIAASLRLQVAQPTPPPPPPPRPSLSQPQSKCHVPGARCGRFKVVIAASAGTECAAVAATLGGRQPPLVCSARSATCTCHVTSGKFAGQAQEADCEASPTSRLQPSSEAGSDRQQQQQQQQPLRLGLPKPSSLTAVLVELHVHLAVPGASGERQSGGARCRNRWRGRLWLRRRGAGPWRWGWGRGWWRPTAPSASPWTPTPTLLSSRQVPPATTQRLAARSYRKLYQPQPCCCAQCET